MLARGARPRPAPSRFRLDHRQHLDDTDDPAQRQSDTLCLDERHAAEPHIDGHDTSVSIFSGGEQSARHEAELDDRINQAGQEPGLSRARDVEERAEAIRYVVNARSGGKHSRTGHLMKLSQSDARRGERPGFGRRDRWPRTHYRQTRPPSGSRAANSPIDVGAAKHAQRLAEVRLPINEVPLRPENPEPSAFRSSLAPRRYFPPRPRRGMRA